jgi:LCP family protein required for cell wall assembly
MAPPEPRTFGIGMFFQRLAAGLGIVVLLACVAIAAQSIIEHKNPFATAMGDLPPVIPSPQSAFHKNRIDYNYDSHGMEYSANARTDTIKAVALNFPDSSNPNGSVSILSVPRDTDVVLPNGREDKINAAYGGFGYNYATAAHSSENVVASFLGIPQFDRYLTLRIDATKDLIDAIGGIDVVPDETMDYDDNWGHLHIHFIGGKKYHMNGDAAVSYSRFRHDACSDPCRIKRQDQVIRITLAKLKNDRFNDLLHINALIAVLRKNVYTDLSEQEMLSLAWAFQHIDVAKLDTQQVPYASTKDLACCGNVLVADDSAKNVLVKKMFLPAIGTEAPTDAAVALVNPATIHVDIQNGSGIRGQGARLAAMLRKKGYQIEGVRNADSFAYDATEIHVHTSATPLAGQSILAAIAIKTATVQPDAPSASVTPGSDVTVIVGRDYAALAPPDDAATAK